MEDKDKQKEIIEFFLNEGILLSEEMVGQISSQLSVNNSFNEDLISNLSKHGPKQALVLQNDFTNLMLNVSSSASLSKDKVNWGDLEQAKAHYEKNNLGLEYSGLIEGLNKITIPQPIAPNSSPGVVVVSTYQDKLKKREVEDFTQLFIKRYVVLERLLRNRREMQNPTSISRVITKREKEQVSIVGMVERIETTKNNNLVLVMEDLTGQIKVLVNKNKPELYEQAKSIVPDEVIGITGVPGDNILFSNNIIWPDIPVDNQLKKSEDNVYVAFISDIHMGSVHFLEEEFLKFIKWLRGETGTEKQKEISSKLKYLIIVGDLVDGVGIYPGQEEELIFKDVIEQYKRLAELLNLIPKHINIIVCPGNHDSCRLAEPQLPVYKDFAEQLYSLPNITLVTNPAMINIHKTNNFKGFNILLYHGYSFDYYVNNVDVIRLNGGYERADLIMKFLLKRRHLAPTQTSTSYIPDCDKDPLVIDMVPDFFVTGHIHYSIAANYRNVSMIGCSCWQAKTPYQEKLGHHPQPCRVPVVNLKTREIKILKFIDD